MHITDIHAHQPETPEAPQDWRTQLGQIVVQIETDSDLVGIGVGGGGAAGIHVIHTVLRDLLLGRDASDVEGLHRAMCDHTVFYGQKGLVVMAISGVDLALWDLRGKMACQPVARLLNPQVDLTAEIPTYVTVFDEATTQQALAAGHRAIKLHVEQFGAPPNVAGMADVVWQIRDTLGPDGSLMMDAFGRWDIDSTLRVAEAVAPYDVGWIEEPLPPDDLEGFAEVVERSPVPIAGGEHEYLARGFRTLIDRRLHAVLQPDVNWCGGLTTLVEIYRMAQRAGLRVCPHRGCEPYALHAICALDPDPLAESPRAWFHALSGFSQISGGTVRLNEEPGFGVALAD